MGLRQCIKDLSLKRGWVIYTGMKRRRIGTTIEMIPWDEVTSGEAPFLS
jgi:hypothetical protein